MIPGFVAVSAWLLLTTGPAAASPAQALRSPSEPEDATVAPPPGPRSSGEPMTLGEAMELAAGLNETPRIAAAQLAQVRAAKQETLALLFPRLTASGTYLRRRTEVTRELGGQTSVIQALNGLNGAVTLQSELFNASAIPLLRRAGRLVDAQTLTAAEAGRELAFEVADAYIATLAAEHLRSAAGHRQQVAQTAVDAARARLNAGLADRNELTRSELELASARLALIRADDGVSRARFGLGFLIGVEANRPLVPPVEEPVAPGTAEQLRSRALEQRQDLQSLKARQEAARLFVEEPWMRLVPSLGLAATVRATNEAGLSEQAVDWNAALTLTWVLYDGGVRYAQAAARAAAFDETGLNADRLSRRIALEIRTALLDLDTAAATLEQAGIRARVASQNREEVALRFGQGLASALENADAIVSEFEAEAEVARQRYAASVARLSLVQALGQWPGEQKP